MSHQFINIKFSDVEIFSTAANKWDIDFRLLEPGVFKAELLHFICRDFHFASTSMNRKVDQQGASPDKFWTFAVLATPSSEFQWHGSLVKSNEIMVYKPFSEINTVSKNFFKVLIYSVREERLESICSDFGYDALPKLLRSSDKVRSHPADINALKRELLRLDTFLRAAYTEDGEYEIAFLEKEARILETLVQCLLNSYPCKNKTPQKLKEHALRQALACIEMQLGEPLTISGLSKVAGVSDRSLSQAFKEHFGIPPKTYIKMLRLNRLHRELLTIAPGKVSISRHAGQFGFWHMGQLAKDYRALFGELPSTTLNKEIKNTIIFKKQSVFSDF